MNESMNELTKPMCVEITLTEYQNLKEDSVKLEILLNIIMNSYDRKNGWLDDKSVISGVKSVDPFNANYYKPLKDEEN